MECIIAGGGISGLLSARELVAAGWKVKVVERNVVGTEASWAGGGILSPLYPWRQPLAVQRMSRWSQRFYPDLAQSLKNHTGIDPQWNRCGLLWLDLPDLETALDWCRRNGIGCQIPREEEIEALQPGLHVLRGGRHLWIEGIAQIRNPRLLKALRRELAANGVEMLEHRAVLDWRIQGERITAMVTSQGNLQGDSFLIAAGAWSERITPQGYWRPQVRPVKGQMLLFKAEPGVLTTMVQRGEHYLIPRMDGRILVGSTVEEADFDKRPTKAAYEKLYRFAVETLPRLADYPLELHWAGMRPAAPEGVPYIGPHPKLKNLYYDCGHFRNGVVMAPAAARLLADLILVRNPILDPEPYLPRQRR